MSKDAEKISVYIKIINFILSKNKRGENPKTKDIISYLEKSDFYISERSVNRYLNDISVDFDVDIEKTSHRGGYRINKENSIYFDDIFQTLQLVEKAFYFKKVLQNSAEVIQYFSFYNNSFKGLEWIDVIVKSIINKDVIEIEHQGFNNEHSSIREIEPYLIKEYIDKWYVVGFDRLNKEIRSFGLDRIKQIAILDKQFKKAKTEYTKERFANTIGLVYSKPDYVVLSFNNNQSKYFKANPWHSNYKIIKDKEDEFIIEMFVSVNYELEQKILMHQTNVKVLDPIFLVDRIKDYLRATLKQY